MKKWIIIAGVVVVGVAVFLLLPLLSTRNSTPPWARDMNHLKQIYLACRMHATDHAGAYPDDWAEIGRYFSDQASVFVTAKNRQSAGALTNVMQWTDYVYVPGNTEASSKDAVVAYLPPGFYPDRIGSAVVFADGHIQWLTVQELTRMLNKRTPTTSRTASR